ncbi:hypothetical protein [Nitriliruptor alkaliphilus]|uniref:hypothetical protein n=1 Tax=Nitriliruptor alkaliphilus TaxID=427918 RepID=UPI000695E194|nr:hypothetical protein [Nitriliruptor alkaliphilus]
MRTAALLAALCVGVIGCGVGDDQPVEVSLAELVEDQHAYDGRTVITSGVVRSFDDPVHYWIEDRDVHRVEVVPAELIEQHVGAEVEVTGRYTFRDDEGRRIEIDSLEVLEGDVDVAA